MAYWTHCDNTHDFILIFRFSAIYTRVKYFLNWIKKNAKDGKCGRKPKEAFGRVGGSSMTDEKWKKFLIELEGEKILADIKKKKYDKMKEIEYYRKYNNTNN